MKRYSGRIFSGLGVATTRTNENKEIYQRLCGFDLYPGTLNIRLYEDFILPVDYMFIDSKEIRPRNKNRNIILVPAKFRNGDIVIMVTDPPFYEANIIEIMAPENLKEKHGLNDGDEVEIEV